MFSCFVPKARHADVVKAAPDVSTQSGSHGLVTWTPEESDTPHLQSERKLFSRALQQSPRPASGQSGSSVYVRQLLKSGLLRSQLARLLKEHWRSPLGEEQITQSIRDEGYETTLWGLIQEFQKKQLWDISFWQSQYHLFVTWSPCKKHPWDRLQTADEFIMLEIGLSAAGNKPVVLLAGKQIEKFSFSDGVLKTQEPVLWTMPDGHMLAVHLQLAFSCFQGYPGAAPSKLSYLGLQCHGLLWPADSLNTPQQWPVSPPLISGKVNAALRRTAQEPGANDSLGTFAGTYAIYELEKDGTCCSAPHLDITISKEPSGEVKVRCGGAVVDKWDFSINNVLTWSRSTGVAWLQLIVVPEGPILLGNINNAGKGLTAYGEPKAQASRISPSGRVDTAVGSILAANLATTSTLLCLQTLKEAHRRWHTKADLVKAASSQASANYIIRMLDLLEEVNEAASTAASVFGEEGALSLDIASQVTAAGATKAAQSYFQASKAAADQASSAAAAARKVANYDPMDSTKLAVTAAWRAYEAALAGQSAEASAQEAEEAGRRAGTAAARKLSTHAVQAYNQARKAASMAADAEAKAASVALQAMEKCLATYADKKLYLKLKATAEASDIAAKASAAAQAAKEAWEVNTRVSRAAAVCAAKEANEYSQQAHKLLRTAEDR
eukprot:jgi/Botrbrau1/20767/Bobra.0156s0002.1